MKKFFVILLLLFFATNIKAQFLEFGRNKVIYNNFDWYVMSTPHFKIYYYKEAKELAEKGASFMEDSYRELQKKFEYSLVDTNPVIFYSSPIHFMQTNTTPGFIPEAVGGFYEFIKNRVVLPYSGSLGDFYHVSKHELVHVFMTSKVANTIRLHGKISQYSPPLWFTEGLAEYWSSDWETQSEMSLKDAVLNNYLPGISDYENIYGSYLMYKLGQSALMYISEKYGEDKILKLIDNIWMTENFSDVMKYTIGKDYEEFDHEFLYYLKKKYSPQLKEYDDPSQVSLNVYSGSFAHKPTYFNNQVFYIGNKTGYTSIYKVPLTTYKKPSLVVEGESSENYEWFHFFRTGLSINSEGMLAFVTQKGANDVLNIFNINKNEKIADFSFDKIVSIGSPSWSKDNRYITFSASDMSGKTDLFLFDYKNEKLTRLTDDFYDDRDADLSPDGSTIVFSSDRARNSKKVEYNLFTYDISTGKITELTYGSQIDYSARYSPDGKSLVYTSTIDGPQNLYYLNLTDSAFKPIRLTNFITAAYDPVWCGNDRIAFSSYEKGTFGVRMIDSVSNKIPKLKPSQEFVKSDTFKIYEMPGLYALNTKPGIMKYQKQFSLDFAVSGVAADPVFGATAGGSFSMSDMLGDEVYNFLIYNNSDAYTDFWQSFNLAVSKVSLKDRLNYSFGIYHLAGRRYDLQNSDYSYLERLYGGYFSFQYPLSFFRRIETSVSVAQSMKDIDFLDNRRGVLISNSIGYVFDNSLWDYNGPVDGQRYNITLGYTTDIQNSTENFVTLMADYRKYFRISVPVSLAFRAQYFMNEGKNPRRFFMGGSWSLRGWPLNGMRGTKMWQTNLELRFPIINILYIGFPEDINIGFRSIKGAVFFDAGNVWDYSDDFSNIKGSIGAGCRINVFGLVVIRWDIGKRIENNFTKLQKGLFNQVLFGWDF